MATVSELANRHNVSTTTIRHWTERFSNWLDVTKGRTSGETRVYSQDDERVIALVAAMRADGQGYDAIQDALERGERGELETSSTLLMLEHMTKEQLVSQLLELRRELDTLTGRYDEVRQREQELRQLGDTRGQLTELQRRAEQMETELAQLRVAHLAARERAIRAETLLQVTSSRDGASNRSDAIQPVTRPRWWQFWRRNH